jgi:elongation factor G
MNLEVTSPSDFLGEVVGDLGRRRAQVKNIDAVEDTQLIYASIPLAETFGYANTLRSLTQGRASFSLEFSAFEEAPKSVVEMQRAI